MLTPQTLSRLPDPLVDLVNELQTEIIQSIAKKLTKANYLTPSAEWQLYKAAQLRMSTDEVNKLLRKYTKLSRREIAALYTEACKQAINNDAKIYRYYGKDAESFTRSVAFSNSLKAGIKNANGMYENLTRSMVQSSRKTVTHLMDKAYLKVLSGAFSPQEAIYSAVKELADKGIQSVTYPSGRTDWADVAVRRAVITGIGQTTGRMQLDLAEDMGTDLVEVTAHSGARPSHAEWQGKVYSISGKSKKYPSLRAATGYGRGDGLKGWNCRHDFFPFFEGLSERANFPVDKEENLREYEFEQKQRGMERAIRKSKRGLSALDSSINSTDDPELMAKLQSDFDRKSNTLKRQEARLSDFCESNGLLPRNDRTRVVGFGRSVSQKAVHGSKRYTAKKADASPKPKPIKRADSKADTEVVKGGRKDTINSAFGIDKSQKNGIIKEKRNSKFDPLKEEKVVPVLRKDSDEWIDRLTKEEKRAIKKYTKNSGDSGDNKFFKRLNAMLRGDLKKDDTLSYYAEHISNALKKNVLMHDIVCYRSADENFFSDFGIGDLVFPRQFLSTSVTKKGALSGKYNMIIYAPKGAKGAYIEKLSKYPKQREFLFDKDCVYRIRSINGNTLEMEVLV